MAKLKIKIPSSNAVRQKVWMLISAVLALLLVLVWSGILSPNVGGSVMDANAAGRVAVDYINKNYVSAGGVVLSSVEDVGGVYKVSTTYQGSQVNVYMTKDGKWLIVGSTPVDVTAPVTTTTTKPAMTCEDLPKASSPELKAFVVSYCPYGLQMQRVLSEIVKNIPSLASNIEVRYIGSITNGAIVSMHGDKEAAENLRQICIREEQNDKYWNYLSCFIKADNNVTSCLTEAGVDTTKLGTCISDSSKGLMYAQEDFNLGSTYGVSGSPTLILNGQSVSEFDFGGRTADSVKKMVCCSFSSTPSACSQTLTTVQAATSFSPTYSSSSSSSSSSASCG